MTKHSRAEVHAEIAHAIKAAKKAMFKKSREGMDLREAADGFAFEVINKFDKMIPRDETRPPFVRVQDESDEPPAAAQEADPPTEYFTTEQLEAIGDRIALDYEHDNVRITPLVGFLGYLATLYQNIGRKSIHPDNVDDVVAVVNQQIYGRVSHNAALEFEKRALAQLRQQFA